mgnify:CR=1 FL=1|jgi:hypothetical protein
MRKSFIEEQLERLRKDGAPEEQRPALHLPVPEPPPPRQEERDRDTDREERGVTTIDFTF